MSATRIKVAIGDWHEEFALVHTTAPDVYDGSGTLTIYREPKSRYVLIPVEQLEWHLCRYASGLYGGVESNEVDERECRDRLVEWLRTEGKR